MIILGISAFYHDSAAVLLHDGKIVAAIEEERLSRIKHDNGFPYKAIEYCCSTVGIRAGDVDRIVYYEKPLKKFERLLETFALTYPNALAPFLQAIPDWLGNKVQVEDTIKNTLGYKNGIWYIPHHLSHASCAYFTSPFRKAAILTIDGVGEYQTTGLWLGENGKIRSIASIDFPDSVGLLYSTFTAYLGFKVNEDEYKLMGLSAYGTPSYADKIYRLIRVQPDGSFTMDMSYFSFREKFRMWSEKFEALFGEPRTAGSPIGKRHRDIAASIQTVTERLYLTMLTYLYGQTHTDSLCISGGVALNALANGKIYTETKFKNVHVFGAAGDSGAALGAGLYAHYATLPNKVTHTPVRSLYLGSCYGEYETERVLAFYGLQYTRFDTEDALLFATAGYLSIGKIVGWFAGPCEFGPRALGARSILARPSPVSMKDTVNTIKRRELFRPFAASVLQEHVHEYFIVPKTNFYSPFMNFCFQVRNEKKREIAAIVHKDNTCRIQTVSSDNGVYYRLLKKYYQETGSACLLNTSFNLKGEPIVEHPSQAVEDYLNTEMDILIVNGYLVRKRSQ